MTHLENRDEGAAAEQSRSVGRHCPCENCGKLAPLSKIKDITGYYMVCAECSGED
jgi:hypothetical protein